MRVAVSVTLTDEERKTLTKWSRGRSTPAHLVLRAQFVMAAAEGQESQAIAAHASTRTTNMYNRVQDEVTLDEVERVVVWKWTVMLPYAVEPMSTM